MKKTIYIFLLSLLLFGCVSRLKVEIQIANRESILLAEKKLPREMIQNIAAAIVILDGFISEWETDETRKVKIITDYVKSIMGADVGDDVEKEYRSLINDKISSVKKNRDEAKMWFLNNNLDQTKIFIDKARLELEELKNIIKTRENLNVRTNNIQQVQIIEQNLIRTTQALAQNSGSERQRFPILGDELASFIAQKENGFIWKGVFNKTLASSFLGNTDIAMILRSNPPEREMRSGDYNNNFTIKGVRTDASDATKAIFNGLTQTINFLASTKVLPLGMEANANSVDNPLPNQNQLLLNSQADRDKLLIKKKKLADYKQLLITKIEVERLELGTDAEVQLKVKRINMYWDQLKIELAKP